MEKQRRYLGKWELGSIVFHLCVAKMFTQYPAKIAATAGSAGWLSVLYTGILFLAVLLIVLRFFPQKGHKDGVGRWYRYLSVVYWLFAAVYGLKEGIAVLSQTAYSRSPDWFLILFLLLGAVSVALCGAKAVFRMHSLLVFSVGMVLITVALFGIGGADIRYLLPIFGTGRGAVFGKGLSVLFLYLDIPFLFTLFLRCRPEVDIKKTVFSAAALGVATNVGVMLIASMGQPLEMDSMWGIPLYDMAKSGVGLGASYLLGCIISLMLYLCLALYLMVMNAKDLTGKGVRRTAAAALLLTACIALTGCYDSREVEKTAYLIALGIDKGENASYRYTFQISNPLETGGTEEEKPKEPETKQEEPYKGVNNLTVEADSFYLALSTLRNRLGKDPDLSHIKVILFSKELAREGLKSQAELLLKERRIRPNTNLCLADSARDFLVQVKPSLEQSPARHYELMFRRQGSPSAPAVELKEFVIGCRNSGQDPVLPIADQEELSGIGIFDGGRLVAEGDARRAMMVQLLKGSAEGMIVKAGESVFLLEGKKKAKVQIGQDKITVEPTLSATLLEGSGQDSAHLIAMLEEEMTNLLRETAVLSVDLLGIGNDARRFYPSQTDWEKADWDQQFKITDIFTKTSIKLKDNG